MKTPTFLLPVPLTTAIVAALILSASAQETTTAPTTSTPPATAGSNAKAKPLAPADKKFFKDASEAILLEQKLAGMAKTGSSNDAVKKLGETIGTDLGKAWTPFATLSQEKGAELTQELSKSDQSNAAKLGKLEPEKFDKEFLKDLGKETKRSARLFDSSKTLQDPELKQWVDTWGPTLKGHDAAVQKAEKEAAKKH